MNRFKIWQIFLIYTVVLLGIIYALPNFYPTKPSLQIAFGDSSRLLNKNINYEIEEVLSAENITFDEISVEENSLKIVFDDVSDQLAGRRLLANYSEGEFIIAMSSEP